MAAGLDLPAMVAVVGAPWLTGVISGVRGDATADGEAPRDRTKPAVAQLAIPPRDGLQAYRPTGAAVKELDGGAGCGGRSSCFGLENILGGLQIGHRVHRLTVDPDLVVEMRAGTTPG